MGEGMEKLLRNKMKQLSVVFFATGVMFFFSVSGYADQRTPRDIPLPLQVEGWEGVTVGRVCLNVVQSYPQIEEEFSLPIVGGFETVLRSIGVKVAGEGEKCDAVLTFTVTLRAIGAYYYAAGRLYTGARIGGRLEMAGEGGPDVGVGVRRRKPTPGSTYQRESMSSPQGAPFDCVWRPAVLEGLAKLWGDQVHINALSDPQMRGAAVNALVEIGDERTSLRF